MTNNTEPNADTHAHTLFGLGMWNANPRTHRSEVGETVHLLNICALADAIED